MAALGFVTSGVGLILIWAGVKGEDLRQVTVDIFTGRRSFAKPAPPAKVTDKQAAADAARRDAQFDPSQSAANTAAALDRARLEGRR